MEDNDDGTLFAQEVAGIKKLDNNSLYLGKKSTAVDFAQRRQSAVSTVQQDNNFLSVDYVEKVAPNDELSYKKDGVQMAVFKRFRQGKYGIEARLDLHRKTVAEARELTYQFINDCIDNDIRIAIVVHGKGERSLDKQATIKSYVNKWLKLLDGVMAFHSAQKHHGGHGAVYVLLRKSDKACLDNWQKQQKR